MPPPQRFALLVRPARRFTRARKSVGPGIVRIRRRYGDLVHATASCTTAAAQAFRTPYWLTTAKRLHQLASSGSSFGRKRRTRSVFAGVTADESRATLGAVKTATFYAG